MNRRELFAALGLTAVAGSSAKAVTDKIPDIRNMPGVLRFRTTNDFIDLTPVNNRISRYKSYERMLEGNPKLYDEVVEKSVKIADSLYNKFNLKDHWMNKIQNAAKRFDAFHLRLIVQNLATYGDYFAELLIDPEDRYPRPLSYIHLGCDSMYRIETVKGDLLEFQQSKEGPDYQSLALCSINKATDADLCKATAIRFKPEQIVHIRAAGFAKSHYPYGVSAIRTGKVEMGYAFENSVKEGIQELVSHFD